MIDSKPTMSFQRIIPFAARPSIRQQIYELLTDDIVEVSDSPFTNPLTVLYKGGKKPRLCGDPRKVNDFMIPERELTPLSGNW
jgi:hypothetical protein